MRGSPGRPRSTGTVDCLGDVDIQNGDSRQFITALPAHSKVKSHVRVSRTEQVSTHGDQPTGPETPPALRGTWCATGSSRILGVSDPTDYLALEEIGFATGLTTNAILVEEAKLAVAIERAIAVRDRALLTLLDTDLDGLETVPEDAAQGYDSELKAGDAPPLSAMSTRSW